MKGKHFVDDMDPVDNEKKEKKNFNDTISFPEKKPSHPHFIFGF